LDYLQGGAGKWQNVEVDEGGARRVKSDAAANGRDMTEAGLSKEELDWCALVVTGVTRGEDVKKAFNRSDLSDVAARQKASRLSRKPEIVTELSRLRQATEQAPVLRKDLPAILTRQQVMKKVLDVVEDA